MSNKHIVYDINGKAHLVTHPVDALEMINSGRFFSSPLTKGKEAPGKSFADVKVVDEDGKEVKTESTEPEPEPDKKTENGSKKGLKKRVIAEKED